MHGFRLDKPTSLQHVPCQTGISIVFHGLGAVFPEWTVAILSPRGDKKSGLMDTAVQGKEIVCPCNGDRVRRAGRSCGWNNGDQPASHCSLRQNQALNSAHFHAWSTCSQLPPGSASPNTATLWSVESEGGYQPGKCPNCLCRHSATQIDNPIYMFYWVIFNSHSFRPDFMSLFGDNQPRLLLWSTPWKSVSISLLRRFQHWHALCKWRVSRPTSGRTAR